MTKPSKSTILLIIAFLASSVAAANFYVGQNAEYSKRVWTEQQLETAKKEKEALEKEVDDLTKAKTELETQTGNLTKQAKAVAEQLAQEKRAREALTTELARVRKDSDQVKADLEQERLDKDAVTEDLARAKQSYQALSNELTTLRQAKEALEKRVKEMLTQRAKEAEQIVVTNPAASAATGPAPASAPKSSTTASKPAVSVPASAPKGGLQGKVLVVNREYNFAVVNLGSKDGMKKGSRLSIWRGDKQVMTAEVDKVYDNMSAANFLEEVKKGSEVKEGDAVRLIS